MTIGSSTIWSLAAHSEAPASDEFALEEPLLFETDAELALEELAFDPVVADESDVAGEPVVADDPELPLRAAGCSVVVAGAGLDLRTGFRTTGF